MSEIIGFVGMSHSPFVTLLAPEDEQGPGGHFLADANRVRRAVDDLQPDAIVVLAPDHFHANFYDMMPPFVLGVEEAVGFGDFGSRAGKLPVAEELAWSVQAGLAELGFDVSLSYSLTVDHGVVQSYEMITGDTDVPMVPLVINTAAPPLPSLNRCVALGHALGTALRRAPWPDRLLVLASGGLSHWLPSNDPRDETIDGEKRSALIHGRANAQAFAAAREPRVKALGGNPDAR
uniref:DODA-type extradiol aromatic ring-opening family dioxygenase n=1 Tax=Nocardia abscessus TaxID=120957 RepID=UPI002457CD44